MSGRASTLWKTARPLFAVIPLLAVASSSCSRAVPAISTPPELRIAPAESMHRIGPPIVLPAEPTVTPVDWTQSPWTPEVPHRDWKYIVIHHTATQRGSVESIHRTHLARKDADGNPWRGIGYHFVIGNGDGMEDGRVEPTFRWKDQIEGAHAGDATFNHEGIGICLVGNFEKYEPTDAQLKSLRLLLETLTRDYGISPEDIKGHGELKSTACPGRYFPLTELTQDLPRKRSPLNSP